MKRRPALAALAVLGALGALVPADPAAAKVLLKDGFHSNAHSFAPTSKVWSSKYCTDPWTTAPNGGVMARTDHGCTCGTGCDFGVYTQGPNHCINSQATDNILVGGDSAWTDYRFRVRLHNEDNDTLGLVFRYRNTANYYAVWFSRDLAPSVSGGCDSGLVGSRLIRVSTSGGTKTRAVQLASSKTTYQVGKTHLVEVVAVGAKLKVNFDANADGKLELPAETLFSVQDKTHKHGAIGLYAYQNGTGEAPCDKGGCFFDDVLVQTAHGGGAPSDPPDSDHDGRPDAADNCPLVPNPEQKDTDGDKLGDACDGDADGDGLDNVQEAQYGSHPLDRDTDDDGLLDGEELHPTEDMDGDGKPNITDPDSDGDGLGDGLESGVSVADKDTDVGKGHFAADLDPQTETDPLRKDTDGDGRDDGVEDTNHNGRIDACESDPTIPDSPPCGGGDGDSTRGPGDAGGGLQGDGAAGGGGLGHADSGDGIGGDEIGGGGFGGGGFGGDGTGGGGSGGGGSSEDGRGAGSTVIPLRTVGQDPGGCAARPSGGADPGLACLLLLAVVGVLGGRARAARSGIGPPDQRPCGSRSSR